MSDHGDGDGDREGTAEPIEATPSARELLVEPGRTLAVVDWVSYAHLFVGVLALLAVLSVSRSAADSLTKVAIALVVALALDIPVRGLQRRGLSRGASATVVTLAALGALGAVLAVLGPPAIREAAKFGDQLPATVEDLYDFPLVGDRLEEARAAERTDEWMEELPGSITPDTVSEVVSRVVAGTTGVVQVLLLTLALLLDGEVLIGRARSLVPSHLRDGADRAGRLVTDTLGRYFAGSLAVAAMNGTYILAVGLVLGVPLVVLAAIWAMLTNLVPQIGGFLGGSVFVTLALTQGALTGVLAAVAFVAYMSTENYVIQPAVVGRAVDLSPPTTMLAAIVGGAAGGVPGALVATPVVGSVKALYMSARHGEDDDVQAVAEHGPGATPAASTG